MILQRGPFGKKVAGRTVPYNLFCMVGIVILLANAILSVLWPFKDPATILVFSLGIFFLLLGMVIFRYFSTFLAILLVVIVFNSMIFWVTFHMGRSSGAMLYYFPFMVGYLYLFLYYSSAAKTIAQVLVMFIFLVISFFYTEMRSTHFILPEPDLEKIYLINLGFSITATIFVLMSLYKQFLAMHQSVLEDKEKEHRVLLRELDMEREKKGYALLLSLRDDISQTLASSRMYLQMYPEQQEFTRKADEQVKAALAGLNDISLELSPSMLIDLGFKEGLATYAGLLTDKYGIPIDIQLKNNSADIPEIVRLSIYRILQQCIDIIAGSGSTRFLHVHLHKGRKLCIDFEHDSNLKDFASRFMDTRNRDLSSRLDYYSAALREEKGRVELDLDVFA